MANLVEFLLPRRPLSHQAGDAKHKQEWKDFVFGRAFAVWRRPPVTDGPLKFTIVHLCEADPADINNIVKPIQDALNSLVYSDDSLIFDVSAHLRMLTDPIDVLDLPQLLAEAVIAGVECVYVAVAESRHLGLELA